MAKTVVLKSMLAAAGLAAALGATAAQAQAVPNTPQIQFVPSAEVPSIPPGLQTACINAPVDGAPTSKTCPVVYYGSTRTWIFSYGDNRTSFAVVTFDSTGKVLRNVEVRGARYIFDVFSDDQGQKLTLVGQSKNSVVINWSDLPH
ncbi:MULTISPECIES: hypothetical protein [unclassified Caulobacter]|uniref:hypothetical protein n=1 Tax=unclassified Caulobacter TaxID=2648921 RepID=UPI0004A77CD6|nr:hypothetical protein [Caulobacter sp. UNC358MFTsu5.1]